MTCIYFRQALEAIDATRKAHKEYWYCMGKQQEKISRVPIRTNAHSILSNISQSHSPADTMSGGVYPRAQSMQQPNSLSSSFMATSDTALSSSFMAISDAAQLPAEPFSMTFGATLEHTETNLNALSPISSTISPLLQSLEHSSFATTFTNKQTLASEQQTQIQPILGSNQQRFSRSQHPQSLLAQQSPDSLTFDSMDQSASRAPYSVFSPMHSSQQVSQQVSLMYLASSIVSFLLIFRFYSVAVSKF